MVPALGSGAGSAIEDALVLGSVLGRALQGGCREEKLRRAAIAFQVYDRIRRPLDLLVQEQSRRMGRLYNMVDLPEDEPAESLKAKMSDCWEWSKWLLSRSVEPLAH
jgi:2-polyprenyl-6-methoxyphenol hydroxylase-like FAD-dependent oxidoreductase